MRHLNEDYEGPPIWLDYFRTIRTYKKREFYQALRREQEFRRSHPHLKLAHVEDCIRETPVLGKEPLFRDGNTTFLERKYGITLYHVISYYEPTEVLHHFLTALQRLLDKRRRVVMKNWELFKKVRIFMLRHARV